MCGYILVLYQFSTEIEMCTAYRSNSVRSWGKWAVGMGIFFDTSKVITMEISFVENLAFALAPVRHLRSNIWNGGFIMQKQS